MSEKSEKIQRFIKFIPSEEALWLLINKPKAFKLLTIVATRARREEGHPDGLKPGQCYLGDWAKCGFSEKEYRTAKQILIDRGHLKIVETCRTRKKSATGTTTVGTLVELISLTIYDINENSKGDRKGDRGATEGRPRGDEQDRNKIDKKEKELSVILSCAQAREKKINGDENMELLVFRSATPHEAVQSIRRELAYVTLEKELYTKAEIDIAINLAKEQNPKLRSGTILNYLRKIIQNKREEFKPKKEKKINGHKRSEADKYEPSTTAGTHINRKWS
jgi:hypothetical protein